MKNDNKWLGNELDYFKKVLMSQTWSATEGSWAGRLEKEFSKIDEILKRFDNKIRDPRGTKKGENVSKIIKEFLKIKCPINKAASELNKFFKKNKINLAKNKL